MKLIKAKIKKCNICKQDIKIMNFSNNIYECEKCHRDICSNCIKIINGNVKCPNCI